TLEGEKIALQADKTLLQGQLATANSAISTLEGEKSALQADKTFLQGQLTTLNTTISTLQDEKSALQSTTTQQAARITELEALLAQCNGKPTAIGTKSLSPLQVYPNPVTNEQLVVSNEQLVAGDKIEVYSLSGALLKTFAAAGATSTVDVSALPTGTYFVKAGNAVAKVVKQ
ncbi:MAG: T9SS type A sorting domain-containing protein, partial [Prevotellaceae bacterium]|nr:T9SS type A sorting domain-containing protein [Prevotellaceae bacterium]